MDPTPLIPRPDAIPVAWGWFQLLLLPTFFLHILLMNAMLGIALIAIALHLSRGSAAAACTGEIAGKLPFLLAFTVNFGVAPYLFLQVLYGHLLYASTLLMAVFWMWIIALLIAAYSLAYVYKDRYARLEDAGWLLPALISLCLLLIGFFFSNNLTMMERPPTWVRYFASPGGTLLNLDDPTLIPRYLHFMLAAPAIGGLAIALFYTYRAGKGAPDSQPWIDLGCRWFSQATLANLAVGLWFLAVIPKGVVVPSSLHGGLFLTLIATGSIFAVLAVVCGFRRRVLPAVHLALAILALMLAARGLLRSATLSPWFTLSELTIAPSVSPMLVFFLFFLAGLLLIGWMLKLAAQAPADPEAPS